MIRMDKPQITQKGENLHEVQVEGCAFEVISTFGDKVTLGQILAARVKQKLSQQTLENQAEMTCLSTDSEL